MGDLLDLFKAKPLATPTPPINLPSTGSVDVDKGGWGDTLDSLGQNRLVTTLTGLFTGRQLGNLYGELHPHTRHWNDEVLKLVSSDAASDKLKKAFETMQKNKSIFSFFDPSHKMRTLLDRAKLYDQLPTKLQASAIFGNTMKRIGRHAGGGVGALIGLVGGPAIYRAMSGAPDLSADPAEALAQLMSKRAFVNDYSGVDAAVVDTLRENEKRVKEVLEARILKKLTDKGIPTSAAAKAAHRYATLVNNVTKSKRIGAGIATHSEGSKLIQDSALSTAMGLGSTSTLGGGAAGGLLGAGLGALISSDKSKGALIGGGLGAAAGALIAPILAAKSGMLSRLQDSLATNQHVNALTDIVTNKSTETEGKISDMFHDALNSIRRKLLPN